LSYIKRQKFEVIIFFPLRKYNMGQEKRDQRGSFPLLNLIREKIKIKK
jgi:hypothetical protein